MDVKVAVVTGANKGLGFELAKGLCKNTKWTVYLTSRDETRGLEACKQMENLSNKPKYHQLDITDSGSIEKFYNHMKSTYRYVDLLINNAGILFLKDSNETKLYQAEQTMFVNFFSLINFTEKMLPIVKNGGKIINVSSSSGHLSRIPSSKLRAIMLDSIDKDVDNLLELMSKYTEAVKGLRETEDGWGESPYVISKVGVNAYTQILHRKLKDRGLFGFLLIIYQLHPLLRLSEYLHLPSICQLHLASLLTLCNLTLKNVIQVSK